MRVVSEVYEQSLLKKTLEFRVAWTFPDLVKDLIGAIYKPTLPIPPCISDNTSASQTIQAHLRQYKRQTYTYMSVMNIFKMVLPVIKFLVLS